MKGKVLNMNNTGDPANDFWVVKDYVSGAEYRFDHDIYNYFQGARVSYTYLVLENLATNLVPYP